jgi:MoaD family protein
VSKVIIRGVSFFQETMGTPEIEMETKEGSTVDNVLAELDIKFDGRLSKRLYNQDGSPSNLVRIFLNGRDIRFLEKKAIALSDGDIILLLPILAGG